MTKTRGLTSSMRFDPGLPRPFGGFTLIELLAVVAIIAVALAVLLPAIQQTREVARRASCVSNVRQLGVAVLNYEAANARYPSPGSTAFSDDGLCIPHEGKQMSWIVSILPFMEQQSLFDRFDFELSVFEQGTDNPAGSQPPSLLCASGGAHGRMFIDSEYSHGIPLGKANYAAWASPLHLERHRLYPGAMSGFGVKTKKVTDGLSNTFMASEVRTRADQKDQRGAWAVPWSGSSLLACDANRDEESVRYSPNPRTFFEILTPNHRRFNFDVIYRCDSKTARGEQMPCVTYAAGTPLGYFGAAPRSHHPNGVNVTFMDGHAKFITDDIDPILMALRVSINDGRSRSEFANDLKLPNLPSF